MTDVELVRNVSFAGLVGMLTGFALRPLTSHLQRQLLGVLPQRRLTSAVHFVILTAALFAACAWRLGPTPAALCGMALAAALLALAWIDLETGLLPDAITLPLAWAGLLVNLQGALAPLPSAVLGAVAGYLFLWAVFHLFLRLTGREGMGYGDFKLMAALGAWFGVEALPWLLLVACATAIVTTVAARLAGKARWGSSFPFGPHLAGAGLFVLLVRPAIL